MLTLETVGGVTSYALSLEKPLNGMTGTFPFDGTPFGSC